MRADSLYGTSGDKVWKAGLCCHGHAHVIKADCLILVTKLVEPFYIGEAFQAYISKYPVEGY